MTQSQLVAGLAVAFTAMGVTLALAGAATVTPLMVVPAGVFLAVAYFMWYHASGRLAARIYASVEAQGRQEPAGPSGGFGAGPREAWERPGGRARQRVRSRVGRRAGARSDRTGRSGRGGGAAPSHSQAAALLGVDPNADEATVRAAYRERIKEVHPDADEGDEEEFKRVREAYEVLAE